MADAVTTTTQVDPAVGLFYERTLLQENRPEYVFNEFAQQFNLPSKGGTTIKMRRYSRYSSATTPLTEGITPNGHKMAKTDLLATVSQYGDFMTITDVVDLTVEDPVMTVEVDLQADQIMNTRDQLTRDVLANNASSTTCSNGTGTATLLNDTDMKAVRQTLRSSDAKTLTALQQGTDKQGTSPVRASYWGIFDADLENDLEKVSGFKLTSAYSTQGTTHVSEYGQAAGIRCLTTTQGYVSSGTYSNPIIAQNAYGVVKLDGGSASSIIKGFGSSGTSDPLDQRGSVGWKMWHVARILNDVNIHVLKCTNA